MSTSVIPQQHYGTGRIVRMALPLMLSFLLEQLIGMTDVAFLGRVGEVELGAAALSGVFFLVLLMLGFGYSFGLQSFMARRNGEKRFGDIGRAFRAGALFLTGLAVLLILVSFFLSGPFFSSVCASADVASASDTYLFWRVWGLPFAFLCAAFRAFFIAILRPAILTASSVVMVLTNCLLNWALIFGCGPIPALGIAGAAIASSVADAVCLIFFAVYSFRRVDRRRYQLFSGSPAGRGLHRELFVLGRWLMIQEAFAFLAWLIFFLAVEHLGETPLAVSNIVRQICSTLFLFIHGFGSACGAIASNLMGEDRPEDVPGVVRRGLVVCTASMLPLMGLIAVFPAATLSVFTSLNEVIEASAATLYVMLGSFAAAIPSMYLLFVMGGMGQTKESSVATMAAAVLYLVYIFAIVSVTDEVAVVWSADYIYYLTAGAVLLAYWRKGSWRTKRI